MTCTYCGKDNMAVVLNGDRTTVCGSAECLLKHQQASRVGQDPFSALIAALNHSGRGT